MIARFEQRGGDMGRQAVRGREAGDPGANDGDSHAGLRSGDPAM